MSFPWRGFLYGPYLPIYSFGTLILYFIFHHLHKYPPLVCLGMILTDLVITLIFPNTLGRA